MPAASSPILASQSLKVALVEKGVVGGEQSSRNWGWCRQQNRDFRELPLADYRYLFDDDARRVRLIECIAIFVEAGWPEARRLFQSLPDLLS